jgi:tubulin beta
LFPPSGARLFAITGEAATNNAQLGRISVFYHGASGGKYKPCAVLFDLEPGVVVVVRASALDKLFRQGNLVNQNTGAGNIWAKAHYTNYGHELC